MKWNVRHIDETDSTNRWLREHLEVDVVVADFQTAGRGCGTNQWEAERGKNLLFSLLLHPHDVQAKDQFRISMAVSIALREMLAQYADGFTVKWPNDIYWRDSKICGILIENRLQGSRIKDSIVGIGLNVNQTKFRSDAPNPVSLCQIVGHEVDRDSLLTDFLRLLERVWQRSTLFMDYENKRGWLYKAARFVIGNYLQAKAVREKWINLVSDPNCLLSEQSQSLMDADLREYRPDNVKEQDFQMFLMLAVQKQDVAMVAKHFGISVSACYKRVERTRIKLKKACEIFL